MFIVLSLQYEAINQAACDLAKDVASKGDALVAGNISQVPAYLTGLGKEEVQKEFKKQTDIFVKNDVDFLIGEVNRRALQTSNFTKITRQTWVLEEKLSGGVRRATQFKTVP